MRKNAKLGASVGAVAIALLVAAYLVISQRIGSAKLLDPDDPLLVQRGAEVYADQCAACHGAELEGQPDWRRRRADDRLPAPPHDETGHTHHHPDELLIQLTKHGLSAVAGDSYQSDMPAYAGILSDGDIRAVLSYIKSTWPPEVRRRHNDLNEQAHAR